MKKTKYCPVCKKEKDGIEFYNSKERKDGLRSCCSLCSKKKGKENKRKIKLEIINAYGKKCVCCGETAPEFLTIDHIKKDGAEHRRKIKIKGGGNDMYAWLKRNNFPKDNYQLLCYNCNCASFRYGKCPHKK